MSNPKYLFEAGTRIELQWEIACYNRSCLSEFGHPFCGQQQFVFVVCLEQVCRKFGIMATGRDIAVNVIIISLVVVQLLLIIPFGASS